MDYISTQSTRIGKKIKKTLIWKYRPFQKKKKKKSFDMDLIK